MWLMPNTSASRSTTENQKLSLHSGRFRASWPRSSSGGSWRYSSASVRGMALDLPGVVGLGEFPGQPGQALQPGGADLEQATVVGAAVEERLAPEQRGGVRTGQLEVVG